MSIFDKLKNLTTGNVDIMTRVAGLFPPLEADSVRNRTNLIQKGKENLKPLPFIVLANINFGELLL